MDTNKAREILQRYREERSTSEEKMLVEQWYKQLIETGEWQWGENEKLQIQQAIESKLLKSIKEGENRPAIIHRIHFRRLRWWAAACILVLLGVGYLIWRPLDSATGEKQIATQEERFKNDVNPGKYKAKLTLADGREIVLDSAALGELAKQGGTVVMNKDGKLVYSQESVAGSQEVLYNILSTAKGETYTTVLSDGSKIWLNSGSSIKFPVAFVGGERKVEITGEAYFEVAASPQLSQRSGEKVVKRPFIVSVNGMEVTVLGTHFNVNAYSDEAVIKTTLLEGSVRVSKAGKEVIIKPGQQAQSGAGGQVSVVGNVDVDVVMAWKNGEFYFKDTDIKDVMKQVERWYDVEVSYESITTETFGGTIPRVVSISKLLQMLELTDHVHFKVEGRKITVMK